MKLLKILLVLALVALVVPASAQLAPDDVRTITPTFPYGLNSVSVVTADASTTTQLVVALTNRRVIEFRVLDASKEVFVALGSTTVTVDASHAVAVNNLNPLKVELDSTVPIAYIASEAFGLSILQMAKP